MVSTNPVCLYCKGCHVSICCDVVTDVRARMDIVRKERLCFNCLGQHKVSLGNSRNRCKKCHRKHHTSLCDMNTSSVNSPSLTSSTTHVSQSTLQGNPSVLQGEKSATAQSPLQPTAASFVPTQSVSGLTATTQSVGSNYSPTCLLKTAIATVRIGCTRAQANIIFDEGAQRSFITQALANQLGSIPHSQENVLVSSFGGDTTKQQVGIAHLTLETNVGDVNISAMVVPIIAAPLQALSNSDVCLLPYLSGVKLAHPVSAACKFDISLLIGVDHYWEIVGNHIIRGNGPTGMQSKLAYLLSGPLPQHSQSTTAGVLHTSITHDTTGCSAITSTMSNLSVNRLDSSQDLSQSSESFMQYYQHNHISRDSDGSYIVSFLWKQNHPTLPTNLNVCDRQTRSLARRLGRHPELLKLYGTIITEQEKRDFIEKVPPSDVQNNKVHYILGLRRSIRIIRNFEADRGFGSANAHSNIRTLIYTHAHCTQCILLFRKKNGVRR